jgi:3-hydroxyisobutyrate dehydrogenase/2-hydroxy-3-oxopropionate reductase
VTTSTTKPTIGFIGLGNMGGHMVNRLIAAGYVVHVWSRREVVAQRFSSIGAIAHTYAHEVAACADIFMTNLTSTTDVLEVLLGKAKDGNNTSDNIAAHNRAGGVIEHLKPNSIFVDFSTIDATVTIQISKLLAAKGIAALDCPVTGGTKGAQAGTLSIMVGGAKSTIERINTILKVLGQSITHVGPAGAGQVVKAANQMVMCSTILGIAEALTYANRFEADIALVIEVLQAGLAGGAVMNWVGPKMATGDTTTTIEARLHEKDLRMIVQTAATAKLKLPILEITAHRLTELIQEGKGASDTSAVLQIVERFAKG